MWPAREPATCSPYAAGRAPILSDAPWHLARRFLSAPRRQQMSHPAPPGARSTVSSCSRQIPPIGDRCQDEGHHIQDRLRRKTVCALGEGAQEPDFTGNGINHNTDDHMTEYSSQARSFFYRGRCNNLGRRANCWRPERRIAARDRLVWTYPQVFRRPRPSGAWGCATPLSAAGMDVIRRPAHSRSGHAPWAEAGRKPASSDRRRRSRTQPWRGTCRR